MSAGYAMTISHHPRHMAVQPGQLVERRRPWLLLLGLGLDSLGVGEPVVLGRVRRASQRWRRRPFNTPRKALDPRSATSPHWSCGLFGGNRIRRRRHLGCDDHCLYFASGALEEHVRQQPFIGPLARQHERILIDYGYALRPSDRFDVIA